MSGKLNWRNAHLSGKRSLSTRDESEYRDRDAASRWLERVSKWTPPKQKAKSKCRKAA